MNRIATNWIVAAACLAARTAGAIAAGDPIEYRYHLLMRTERGVDVVPVAITTAEPVTRTHRPEDGVLDVLVPVGHGGSGSLIQAGTVKDYVVECRDGAISVTAHGADGREFARPARRLADLAGDDIRVSVSGSGVKRAFLVLRNEEVVADDAGGTVDPFAGKVPLGPRDYVVFTDTFPHAARTTVTGEAPLVVDGWPFAEVRVAGGEPMPFIVDTGAATTIVVKDALPHGVEITRQSMVEYSAAGRRLLDYAPEGATGSVTSIEGAATLSSLALGSIEFKDAEVDVIGALPDFSGRKIGGILGLDLLRRARVVELALSGERPRLRLASAQDAAAARSAPFSLISGHVVVAGALAGKTVRFVLDSGSPGSILDRAAADALGLARHDAGQKSASGLDGGSVALVPVEAPPLELAGARFERPAFRAGDLAVFAPVRGDGQLAGLLGTELVARLARIEIDFEARAVRCFER